MKPGQPLARRRGLKRTGFRPVTVAEVRASEQQARAEFDRRDRELSGLVGQRGTEVVHPGVRAKKTARGLARSLGDAVRAELKRGGVVRVLPRRNVAGKVTASDRAACDELEKLLNGTGFADHVLASVVAVRGRSHGFGRQRKALPRRSKDQAKRARVSARQYGDLAFRSWIHRQPCQLAGVAIRVQPGESGGRCRTYADRPGIEEAHIRSRGAGHGVTADGQPNVLSLCPAHHDWQGRRSAERVQRETGVDLWAIAARQQAEYSAETGGARG